MKIYLELFFSFLQIGAFSFGGGYAAMPLIQHQVVEAHSWLSLAEFTDLVTISQMTPGPIAINAATFVGIRIGGLPGAAAATLGCIFPSCVIVLLIAWLYKRYRSLPLLQGILQGLRPAVVALIGAAGLSILVSALWPGGAPALADTQWRMAAIFAVCFYLLEKKKWDPILVMVLAGGINLLCGLLAAGL